jgi:hypothetical protein
LDNAKLFTAMTFANTLFRCAFTCAATAVLMLGCQERQDTVVFSPDGDIVLRFAFDEGGTPQYGVMYKGNPVIQPSGIGFEIEGQPALGKGMEIARVAFDSLNETWDMPWGEQNSVENHYKEMRVALREVTAPNRRLDMVFRVFDDGLGFRFEFPEQPGMEDILITAEHTSFRLSGDHEVWWLPGDWDTYEQRYSHTKFTEINALAMKDNPMLAATYIP